MNNTLKFERRGGTVLRLEKIPLDTWHGAVVFISNRINENANYYEIDIECIVFRNL